MDELVTWLREQITEDRQFATEAMHDRDGTWTHVVTPGGDNKVVDDLGYSVSGHYDIDSEPWWTQPHIARHDPRTVLAVCNAYTAILDRYETSLRIPLSKISGFVRGQDDGYQQACLDAIRDIAASMADRPGYRAEWRPTTPLSTADC
jgi:hypothetical protein